MNQVRSLLPGHTALQKKKEAHTSIQLRVVIVYQHGGLDLELHVFSTLKNTYKFYETGSGQ